MQILKFILRWSLISVIYFIFYTLIVLIVFAFYFEHIGITASETDYFNSSISSWIDPYSQGFDDYVKHGKNFKLVSIPSDSRDFIAIIELPKNNFVKIEQEFNKISIDSFQISCNQSDYIGLCKIMEADEETKLQFYTMKRGNDEKAFWVLYKDKEKLGVFSHIPSPYEFLYKKIYEGFYF